MSAYSYGSLDDVVAATANAIATEGVDYVVAPDESPALPGLTLVSYTLKENGEFLKWNKPEAYLVGVAFDATGTVFKLPVGVDDPHLAEERRLPKVDVGKEYKYMGQGLPLVLPPTRGFLAVRLLIADSDSSARRSADAVKAVGDAIDSAQVVALMAATGLPQAAAASLLLGTAMKTTAMMMEQNRDDVIETFEGYFLPIDMHGDLEVAHEDASATFRFVSLGG